MTAPFQSLLRFAFGLDLKAIRTFADFVHARVQRARPRDADDLEQEILYKLAVTPERAVKLANTLARRNPALASALDATAAGAIPVVPTAALDAADRQLDAYVGQMIRNAEIDRARRQRKTVPLDEPERVPDAATLRDDEADLFALGERVLDCVRADATRTRGIDEALGEIQVLAEGRATMDALSLACVAGDPELRALDPEAARIKARNRLQKRHQRARDHVLATIQRLVDDGDLDEDEGREARRWMNFLKRRQNPSRAVSPGEQR